MSTSPPAADSPDPHEPNPRPAIETRLWHSATELANIAATTSWRLTKWWAHTTVENTRQMLHESPAGESLIRIAADAVAGLTTITHDVLGSPHIEESSSYLNPTGGTGEQHIEPHQAGAAKPVPGDLRECGDHLLDRSADVDDADDPHPAYQRILGELAPDEARILRLLAVDGPQPSVDVRTARPLGKGTETIAGGLTMTGEHAGCRHVDRTHAYLNNLNRLGLAWFSKEPLSPRRYQLVEVQPAVLDAKRRAGRASKIIRRSINLTPFGEDFCRTCFTLG